MGHFVRTKMTDKARKYHNVDHISRLYQIAKSWNLEYDADLDAAILWHDVIYDAQDDKEKRSTQLFLRKTREKPEWATGIDRNAVRQMIMNTETHELEIGLNSALIMLDVAELADPKQRYENFWNILAESCMLYKKDAEVVSANMQLFMQSFKETMEQNAMKDFVYSSFWADIADGCQEVANIAKIVHDTHVRLCWYV